MTMQERPTSLREVLDAGCDLTSTGLWLEGLAEDLYTVLPFYPPKERARRAAQHRACVESLLLHGEDSLHLPPRSDRDEKNLREFISLELWTAEAYEDEELAVRLREALPVEIKVEYQAYFDRARRPHPLVLIQSSGGAVRTAGPPSTRTRARRRSSSPATKASRTWTMRSSTASTASAWWPRRLVRSRTPDLFDPEHLRPPAPAGGRCASLEAIGSQTRRRR